MKKMWIWCLLAAVSVVSVASLHAKPADDTAKAVEALELQWLKGQKTNNPDVIAPLLADKIVVTDGDGKVTDKAETIAWYKKVHFDSAEYSDLKVAVFGDAAIASGGFKGKGTDASEDVSDRAAGLKWPPVVAAISFFARSTLPN